MTKRAPNWTFDEILLVADLGFRRHWKYPAPSDPEVIAISELLNKAPIHPLSERGSKFRNANGVARKFSNLDTIRPDYEGVPTRGGKEDKRVLEYFLGDPVAAHEEARRVRELIDNGDYKYPPSIGENLSGELEGRQMLVQHYRRERSASLRRNKIKSVLARGEKIACETCAFDFFESYGERGKDFIEVHHTVPLHRVTEAQMMALKDLALLCANCHRMIHRGDLLSLDELKGIVHASRWN